MADNGQAAPLSAASDAAERPAPLEESDFAPPDEKKNQRSLFGEILNWMLVPLLLLWPISIALTYIVAKSIANQPYDHALEDKVTALAQQVREVDGKIVAMLTNAASDILLADEKDMVFFRITGPHGEHINGDSDLPLAAADKTHKPGTVRYVDAVLHGIDVRIAYTDIDLRMLEDNWEFPSPPRLVRIQVGETLGKRAHLANEIIKGVIFPQFIVLPIALGLIWLALSRGLAPLVELQRRIHARRPYDLSPIESGQVPEEITPLVVSLNDLLDRLSHNIDGQKRFIADAAHQMKTPLAGMRMQSELALRLDSPEEIQRSLQQLAKSSESATRLVNQLLALARAEYQHPAAKPFVPIELADLARDIVHDWVQASFARQIDLGFEQPDYPAMILGNPVTLRELLNNLIDNALRYTPANGAVTVRVYLDPRQRQPTLEVEDSGPGIAPSERSRVFERFYRILGSNTEGSGLGLAIVREIAQQHDATIDIANNPHSHTPKLPGCLIRVTFPAIPEMQSAPENHQDA